VKGARTPGFLASLHQVKDAPRRDAGWDRIWGGLEGLAIECQRVIQPSRPHQFLPLPDELRLLLAGRLRQHRREGSLDDEEDNDGDCGSHARDYLTSPLT